MEKQVPVQCQFLNEEDLPTILNQSFGLYLTKTLVEQQCPPGHGFWPS